MPLGKWKTISGSTLASNTWWTYRKDEYELPSGKRGEYHFVHTNGASMVIPVTGDGKMVLVNQYRYLRGCESTEFPCGGVKDGSSYDETARHELREETGFTAKSLVPAGEFNPYNGVTDEICRIYLARDLEYVGGHPDETEEFEIVRLTPAELESRIASGEVWDGMTIAAWGIVRHRLIGGGGP